MIYVSGCQQPYSRRGNEIVHNIDISNFVFNRLMSDDINVISGTKNNTCGKNTTNENMMVPPALMPNATDKYLLDFIKPDQLHPWIKSQLKMTIIYNSFCVILQGLSLPRRTQLRICGGNLSTLEHFMCDPWAMDQTGVGVTKTIPSVPGLFRFFQHCQTTR